VNLLGPVTDAEQTGWQRRAAGLLADYLDTAVRADLPPIRWTITPAGSTLMGHCQTGREWDLWQAFLQLPDIQPEIVRAGRARRRASGRVTAACGLTTQVVLIADIDLDREHLNNPPEDTA
jgi:hypothetical protein